jgi:hypothetical protein
MKNNRFVSSTVASILCVAGVGGLANSAQANITYDNTIAPLVGSGNTSGAWTTGTDNGLALSLRSQYNTPGHVNATPNDGMGTFFFGTGTPTKAQWDFWFDVNPGATSTVGDTFVLTIAVVGGATQTIDISSAFPSDNGHNGTEFQNSEDVGFSFIGFDPSQAAIYDFSLSAVNGGTTLDTVDMTVINGTPVPEPTTVTAAALLLLPFGGTALRLFRKNRAA